MKKLILCCALGWVLALVPLAANAQAEPNPNSGRNPCVGLVLSHVHEYEGMSPAQLVKQNPQLWASMQDFMKVQQGCRTTNG